MTALILIALLILVSAFAVALVRTNRTLQGRLAVATKRADDMRAEGQYWLERYGERNTQALRYHDGLQAVVHMRTGKMANIGHRMSAAAAEALRG